MAGEGIQGRMNLSNSYLGFDGFNSKSKPKLSAEEKAKKRQALKDKGKKLVDSLKTQYDKAGGAKGILDTANNVKKFLKDDSPTTPDYDVNAGNKDVQDEEKKGVPVLVWVIGGVAILVTGIFIFVHVKNAKQVQVNKNVPPLNSATPPTTHL